MTSMSRRAVAAVTWTSGAPQIVKPTEAQGASHAVSFGSVVSRQKPVATFGVDTWHESSGVRLRSAAELRRSSAFPRKSAQLGRQSAQRPTRTRAGACRRTNGRARPVRSRRGEALLDGEPLHIVSAGGGDL